MAWLRRSGEAAFSYPFLLWVCCLLGGGSYVASYLRIPLVPLFARELGAGAVMVGFINSAFLLTTGACALPLGLAADRLGRKRLVVGGLGLCLLTALLLALSTTPAQLLVISLLFGLGLAAVGPTLMAYVADFSPPTHLGRSYGAYTLAIYGGMSLGPALGGWLAQVLDFRPLFLVAGALVGVVALLALVFLPGKPAAGAGPAAAEEPPPSWRRLLRHRPLLGCWLITFGGCFGLGMFVTFAPLHTQDQGLSMGEIGLVFALQAAVNALSRIPFGRLSDRLRPRWRMALAGFLTLGASLVGFGLARSFWQFLLAGSALGLAMGLGFTPVGALIAEVVPPNARGLAMGGYNTCIYLGMMCSSAVMGILVESWGFLAGYILSGLAVALAGWGFYVLIRDFSPPPPPP